MEVVYLVNIQKELQQNLMEWRLMLYTMISKLLNGHQVFSFQNGISLLIGWNIFEN